MYSVIEDNFYEDVYDAVKKPSDNALMMSFSTTGSRPSGLQVFCVISSLVAVVLSCAAAVVLFNANQSTTSKPITEASPTASSVIYHILQSKCLKFLQS